MASRRMRGRSEKAGRVLSAAISNHGESSWTVSGLRRKVEIPHGLVSYMHGNGLVREIEKRGGVSLWTVTSKGRSMVQRGRW